MANTKVYVAVNHEVEECYTFLHLLEIKQFVVTSVLDKPDTYIDDYIGYVKDIAIENCLAPQLNAYDYVCNEFDNYIETYIGTFFGWYIYETVLQ